MESQDFALLPTNCKIQEPAKDVPFLCRKRYFVTFMVFLGILQLCVLRQNLAIAIVDMTTAKNITDGNRVYLKEAEFNWSPFEVGILLGIQGLLGIFGFIGGYLSCKYGGVKIFGGSICIQGIIALISPLVVRWGVPMFAITRMLESLFCAISFVACLQVFVKWAPSSEKFRMVDYSSTGFFFGVVLVFPVCGIIIEYWGWPYVFYSNGAIALIWYFIWIIFIYEDPQEDKFISREEQNYIIENIDVLSPQPKEIPWKQIFKSKPVLAYFNERFVEAWSFSFAIDCLPLFVQDAFDVSISHVGLISSVPNLCNLLGVIMAASAADFLRNRKIASSSKIYMVIITACQITCVALFIIMGFWANFVGLIFCICFLRFAYGCASSAYSILPLDIAGEYASILTGFGATIFNIGGVLNPILMRFFVPNHSLTEWCHYFLFLGAFNIWGATIFFFLGSGEPEPWTAVGKVAHNLRSRK